MYAKLKDCLENKTSNYLAPFLWLHNEDDALIEQELRRIRDCGIRAVCLESRTHEEFCREDWWQDLELIFRVCKELDMKVWILDDKHFPSGYANGIFIDQHRDLQPWSITERHVDLAGPVRAGSVLVDQWKPAEQDTFLAAIALKRLPGKQMYTGEAIDLTDSYSDGLLFFDLPEGLWSVVLLFKTQEQTDPRFRAFSDKLNSDATKAYIEEVYEPHYAHFADEFGKTFLGFFSDEPCFHNNSAVSRVTLPGTRGDALPWHENFFRKWETLYPDDAWTKLCGLWFDFTDRTSEAIREQYMDIISAMYRDNFCNPLGKWCEEHGVDYIGHIIEDNNTHYMTGAGPGHYFRSLEGQHMAGIDVVLHQIVPGLQEVSNTGYVSYKQMNQNLFQYVLAKLGASAAHQEPKKQRRAMCEIFGAYGWAEGVKTMKYLLDHMLVRGINYFVPHAFSPKVDDADCPPSFYNGGKNPLYKHFGELMEYTNRVCHVLEGGVHQVSAALIYDAESAWSGAERTPLEDIAKVLYDHQLDYDIIPFDRLEELDADGCINGEQYPVLILPATAHLADKNREKLVKLQAKGIRVIAAGDVETAGFEVVSPDALADVLEPLRDLTFSADCPYLRFLHYVRDGKHLLMLSNEDITRTAQTTVRVKGFAGDTCVIYDPLNNRAETVRCPGGEIPVTLAPYHSRILFPGEALEENTSLGDNLPAGTEPLDLRWSVSTRRETEEHFTFAFTETALKPINRYDGYQSFSGNIRYESVLHCDAAKRFILDLGQVAETAKVTINGKHAGTKILPPFRFDITPFLQAGENTITVEVSTTLAFEQRDPFSCYLLLEAAGMIGPVTCCKE